MNTYAIEISSREDEFRCLLEDNVQAELLVDAYAKAQDIVKALNEKHDRDDVFVLTKIIRMPSLLKDYFNDENP